jgi:hypothetical protein
VVQLGEAVMVLDLHHQGLTVSAIARELGLDCNTVRNASSSGSGQRQDMQTIPRCHMAAFEAIGGVPNEILTRRLPSSAKMPLASSTTGRSSILLGNMAATKGRAVHIAGEDLFRLAHPLRAPSASLVLKSERQVSHKGTRCGRADWQPEMYSLDCCNSALPSIGENPLSSTMDRAADPKLNPLPPLL